MKLWKVVILVDLALVLGIGGGYLWWGRRAAELGRELTTAQAAPGGEREWEVRGVVRAILPEMNLIVMTHEALSGFMPSMTMGFRAESPKIYEGLNVGDEVRFTVKGIPPNVAITAIRKQKG